MKNLKPFLIGSVVGCGVMFVALQYHVVHSHDGLQLIPRAPQANLGLAWADVREWDAATWAERPELARALVAHGSSDLISESVAREIANSADPDSGTIGRLRSLLNDSMSSEFDAPLFEQDDSGRFGDHRDDSLAIPFPQESRNQEWGDLFTLDGDSARTNLADGSRTRHGQPSTGFADLDDVIADEEETERLSQDRFLRLSERPRNDPFSEAESSWRSRSGSDRSSRTDADSRARTTTILEDLLFSEDESSVPEPGMDSAMRNSRFDSVTRALESRASRALDRASSDFFYQDHSAGSGAEAPQGTVTRTVPSPNTIPHAVRALRDGFDPFVKE